MLELLPLLMLAPEPPPIDPAVAGPEGTAPAEAPERPDPPMPDEPAASEGAAVAPDDPALPEPPDLPEPPGSAPEPPGSEPEPEPLRWSAPVGCPSAAELRQGIELRLGRPLGPREAQIDARVDPGEGGYRLTLRAEARGVSEQRTLDADDCGALTAAAALIVALAVDPVAVAEVMESTAEPDALPPAPRRRSASPGPSTPESAARGFLGGLLRVGAGVGLGAGPGATAVPSLSGGLRWGRARLELEGSYWIPRPSEPIESEVVRVQLGTAALRGCGVLARDRLEAPLCGGLQLGGMRGDYEQVSRTTLWLALEAGVGLSWWFAPRFGLAGGFTAAVPLVRPGFDAATDPPVRLFEPSSVAGRLWLGIELRLGS